MSGFDKKIHITICGGGNGAHTLAGISSFVENAEITVVDIFEDEAERWTDSLSKNGFSVDFGNGNKLQQNASDVRFAVTREYAEIISKSDVVIIVVPAFTHALYLSKIAAYLSDDCLVVGMPGQPGFEYQCLYTLRQLGKKCSIMTLETLPWACRIAKYGEEVTVMGTKDEVAVSLIDQVKPNSASTPAVETIQRLLGKTPVLKQVGHPLELTLSTKASIHPPLMFAKWKCWSGEELDSPPLFYKGVDELAVRYLDAVSNEVIETSRKLQQIFPDMDYTGVTSTTMHSWLVDHYGDQIQDKSSLMTSLITNKAYDGLNHPMTKTSTGKYVPNFKYRYLAEDVPYGLVVLRAIAEMVGVKTPAIDEIITWAQQILGVEYLIEGKITDKNKTGTRLPQTYGIETIQDFVTFFNQ